jgi:hypothetical protein
MERSKWVNRYFPVVIGVREQRFPTRRFFYFAGETGGNWIVRLVLTETSIQFKENEHFVTFAIVKLILINIINK